MEMFCIQHPAMRAGLLLVTLSGLCGGCATFDDALGSPMTDGIALGPERPKPDRYVVTVTQAELAALGLGQRMELEMRAPDVMYVVEFGRIEQLDALFAQTIWGRRPVREIVPVEEKGGKLVLMTAASDDAPAPPADAGVPAPTPTSAPTDG